MTSGASGPLGLDADELVACVACGLCLPHCPTYRVTGLEIASPRGRIAAMRMVELDDRPVDDAFLTAMNECVQCRGCEAACPSSVQFGHLMEHTRAALYEQAPRGSIGRRAVEWLGYRLILPVHALLMAVNSNDYALMQGIFLVITLAVLGANLLVDLLYGVIDPRTRARS